MLEPLISAGAASNQASKVPVLCCLAYSDGRKTAAYLSLANDRSLLVLDNKQWRGPIIGKPRPHKTESHWAAVKNLMGH